MTEYVDIGNTSLVVKDTIIDDANLIDTMQDILNKDKLRHNNYTEWFEDVHPYTNDNTDVFTGIGRWSSKLVNPLCNHPKFAIALILLIVLFTIIFIINFSKCDLLTAIQISDSDKEVVTAIKPYITSINDRFNKLPIDKKKEIQTILQDAKVRSNHLPLTFTDNTKIINV